MSPKTDAPAALPERSQSLIELAPAYAMLADLFTEAEGEITDEALVEQFQKIGEAMESKVDSLQMLFRRMTGDAAACQALADHIAKPYQERAAKLLKGAERIKRLVFLGLQAAQLERLETRHGGARIQNNGGVLPVLFEGDAETLPEAFRRVTYAIDTQAVLAAKPEELPQGVRVGERGRHLRWI